MNVTGQDPFPVRPWQLSVYICIATSGFVGNLLVLFVIRRIKEMKDSPFGVYLAGLAVADLLVALSCIPVYITSTSAFKDHPKGWQGDIFCKVVSGYNILFFFATISVYTLVAISLERYLAICHPFNSRFYLDPSRAYIMIFFIWVFAIILGIPSILGEIYAPSNKATIGAHCAFSSVYTGTIAPKAGYLMVFTVQFILPVSVMIFCFIRIRRQLLCSGPDPRLEASPQQQYAAAVRTQNRKRSVLTVIIVIVSYFTCWSMNQVIYFCYNFQLIKLNWNSNVVQISVVLCFLSSCLNPFIYAFRSRHFRQQFSTLLTCWRAKPIFGGYQRIDEGGARLI